MRETIIGSVHVTTIIAFVLLLGSGGRVRAADERTLADCAQIEDAAERLACYDEVLGRIGSSAAPIGAGVSQDSYLSKVWELDVSQPRDRYVLMVHRANYILLGSYNNHPNQQPIKDTTGQDVLESEVVFQISQKIKLWQDVLGKDMDLWVGYTQRSFWQLYNTEDSSPFRETNYEPEVLLNFRTQWRVLGMDVRALNVGFNHQSNGRSEPLSRSWNRLVGSVGLEKGGLTLGLTGWVRLPESADDDDNPDIDEYMGPGELWAYYFWRGHRFGAMLRNNLEVDDNRGAVQLEWSFPLVKHVSGYLQYFTGYGESMLDYNHSVNRIGAGFILRDWD